MKQQEFNMLDDKELVWVCGEPIIQIVRGKDPEVKLQAYLRLNDGQRALLMFQVLYGHAKNGIGQFYHYISYLMEKLDFWSALKAGMKYFGDQAMLGLIVKMEETYYAMMKQTEGIVLPDELDTLYKKTIPTTLKLIGEYIRNNPYEFIQIEN
jgi:hypothetical protein